MATVDLKETAKELIDKRTGIEKQINAILARLEGPGGGGVNGNLVDAEVRAFRERKRDSEEPS